MKLVSVNKNWKENFNVFPILSKMKWLSVGQWVRTKWNEMKWKKIVFCWRRRREKWGKAIFISFGEWEKRLKTRALFFSFRFAKGTSPLSISNSLPFKFLLLFVGILFQFRIWNLRVHGIRLTKNAINQNEVEINGKCQPK